MKLIISLVGLVAWGLWGYTVLFIEPDFLLAPIAFYLTLFVALTCTLSRVLIGGSVDERGNPSHNLGHGAIVSVLILFALWLQSLRMLTPLNAMLLAALFGFIELGFWLSQRQGEGRARRRMRRAENHEGSLAGLSD
jgi:hypothetical protein